MLRFSKAFRVITSNYFRYLLKEITYLKSVNYRGLGRSAFIHHHPFEIKNTIRMDSLEGTPLLR